jgi:TP901-1 family phage major tail protein
MATASVLNGSLMCFYLEEQLMGSATSHSIVVNMATRDITTKSNLGWRAKLEGMRDWTGSAEGYVAFDDTFGATEFFAYVTNRTKLTLKFSTEVSGDDLWTGECYITSFTVDAPMEENTTYSISFEGASSLTVAAQT